MELEPFTTNEDNTKKSFKEIDKLLTNTVKKKSPADYNLLYGSVMGYYNQNISFDYNDMIEKVFDNYKPINDDKIDMRNLKLKLEKLPEKRFDRCFDIAIDAIRKNKPKTYKLSEEIDLTIKDSINNLKHIITAEKKDNDEMYIKIKVDERTYNEFNFK